MPQRRGSVSRLIQYGSSNSENSGSSTSAKAKDGTAEFDLLVLDGSNRLYVMDKQGVARKTIGGPGTAPGDFLNARGLAISEDGEYAYVADTGNNRIQRFRIHDSQLQAIAGGKPRPGMQHASYGLGSLPGGEFKPKRFALESLDQPHGIAIHGDRLFVCDTWNHRVVVLSTALPTNFVGLARATSDEVPVIPELQALKYWGTKGRDTGCFQYPKGIAIDPGDANLGIAPEVIVADTRNHRLQCFTLDGKFTRGVSGERNESSSGMPGRMKGSQLFSFPSSVHVSTQSGRHVFVADQRAIVVLNLATLEPTCVLALSNPSRQRSARPATQSPATLCGHMAPMQKGVPPTLLLYVAEYDEHAVREVVLTPTHLRNDEIDATASINIFERRHKPAASLQVFARQH